MDDEHNYESALRDGVIPFLERTATAEVKKGKLGLFERVWEDSFMTGISGDYGLPEGVYDVILVKTGELTVRGIMGSKLTCSTYDDRVKDIYDRLASIKQRVKKANNKSRSFD